MAISRIHASLFRVNEDSLAKRWIKLAGILRDLFPTDEERAWKRKSDRSIPVIRELCVGSGSGPEGRW